MRSDTLKFLVAGLAFCGLGLFAFLDNLINREVSKHLSSLENRIEAERNKLRDAIKDASDNKLDLELELVQLRAESKRVQESSKRVSEDLLKLQPKKTEMMKVLEDQTLLSALHKLRYDHRLIKSFELRVSMQLTPGLLKHPSMPRSMVGLRRKSDLIAQFAQTSDSGTLSLKDNPLPIQMGHHKLFPPFETRLVGTSISSLSNLDTFEIVYPVTELKPDLLAALREPRRFEFTFYLNQVPLPVLALDNTKFDLVENYLGNGQFLVATVPTRGDFRDMYRLFTDRIRELNPGP